MTDPTFISPFDPELKNMTPFQRRQREVGQSKLDQAREPEAREAAALAAMRAEIRALRAESQRRERVARESART